MAKSIVLDTSVLPVRRGLDGPLWLSVRRLCDVHGIEVLVPSIVVHESVHLRGVNYSEAEKEFLDAFKKLSRHFDLAAVYVPSVDEITSDWRDELTEAFTEVAVHRDDAVEALEREALRKRPAHDGVGGRDSAIWRTVVRRAVEDEVVYFISNNTKDFAEGTPPDLHSELVDEVAAGNVRYLKSVNELIDQLAEKIEVPAPSVETATEELGPEIAEFVGMAAEDDERFQPFGAVSLGSEILTIQEVVPVRAYAVDDKKLVLVNGTGQAELQTVSEPITVAFEFVAWMDFLAASDEPVSGELYSFQLS